MPVRSVKIRVENPEQSKAVQEYLFINDCAWPWGIKDISYLNGKYLYVDSKGTITYGNSDSSFEGYKDEPELKFDYHNTVTAVPKPRPTVSLFGKIYDKEELDAALSKLSTVKA